MTDLDPRWRAAVRRHAETADPTPEAWAAITDRADRDDADLDPAAVPPGRARWVLAAAAVVVVLGLAALAVAARPGDGPVDVGPAAEGDETTTDPAPDDGLPAEVEAWGMVLESAEHGPELCLGTGELVSPPQCRGVPLVGWHWDATDAENVFDGTTWGDFHVVGTYDGETLRLTEPPGPPDGRPEDTSIDTDPDRYRAPCPEPPGGWAVTDPGRVTPADREALQAAVQQEPDFGALWVDSSVPMAGGVLTVTFTGDLDRHRTELAAVWGGPLCVAEATITDAEMTAARDTVSAAAENGAPLAAGGLSIPVTGTLSQDIEETLLVWVTWAPPGAEEALTELLDVPVVVEPLLRPRA